MSQEISIHRSIAHEHVVQFHTYFEDKDFIYIVLELCSKRVSRLATVKYPRLELI